MKPIRDRLEGPKDAAPHREPTEPNRGTTVKAVERATDLLADLLAEGPRATGDIREAAQAAGLKWRTVETAKAALAVRATKDGRGGWSWSLGADMGQDRAAKAVSPQDRKAASPQVAPVALSVRPAPAGEAPALSDPVALADLAARVASLAASIERIDVIVGRLAASLPDPAAPPAPRPAAGPTRPLPDLRRAGARGVRPGQWGQGTGVRCADCIRADQIAPDGYCGAGARDIRWPYARRTCPAFELIESEHDMESQL